MKCLTEMILILRKNCQNTSCGLIDCSQRFGILYNIGKNRPKSFLHWNDGLLFQSIVFSTACYFLKEWSYNFHSNCQNILWNPCNFSFTFLCSIIREKKSKTFFSLGRLLFFKNLCFQQKNRPYRNDLIASQKLSEYLVEPKRLFPEVWHAL